MYRYMIAASFLVGCYSPELADCTIVCADSDECSGDQSCVGGLCTSGGSCTVPDAGNGGMTDAGSNARMVTLKAQVMGDGKVVIANVGECQRDSTPAQCTWQVPAGSYNFEAVTNRADKPFDRWNSLLCGGQDATCSANVLIDGTVVAKFK